MMIDRLLHLFYSLLLYVWNCLLTVVERTTGIDLGCGCQSKLEDIIVKKRGAEKCRRVEKILRNYPNELISSFNWDTGDETDAAEAILEESGSFSNSTNHHLLLDSSSTTDDRLELQYELSKSLAKSMRQIRGYQKLCKEVEERRLERYSLRNEDHEKDLLKLWTLLANGEELSARKSHQWQQIGFQGDDPATDFRGMGILGLDQLIFFAQYDVESCSRVFSLSQHPRLGYPFAIAGISISQLCKDLLLSEQLKNHFYNAIENPPLAMNHFHQVYCRTYTLFADFWLWSEPESVMEFNEVKRRFADALERYLQLEQANLCTATIDDILRFVRPVSPSSASIASRLKLQ